MSMSDHADHIHVGFQPRNAGLTTAVGGSAQAILKPKQWTRLVKRLGRIDNPRLKGRATSARGVRDRCVGRVQRLGIDCRRVDRLDPPQKQQRGEGGGNHHRSADPVRGADARDQRVLRRIEHVGEICEVAADWASPPSDRMRSSRSAWAGDSPWLSR